MIARISPGTTITATRAVSMMPAAISAVSTISSHKEESGLRTYQERR